MYTENRTIRGAGAALLALALLGGSGCTTMKGVFGKLPGEDNQAQQLAQARTLIGSGKTDQARKLLTAVTTGAKNPGITDEALFHLGLIFLKEETESGGFQQSRQLLGRLAQEYPQSVWGVEGGHLNELLRQSEGSLDKVRRQVKSLKDTNISLSKENKELRLNIEKLKNLDLELEHKSRR